MNDQPCATIGRALTESDYKALERCAISREIADAAGLRRLTDPEAREWFGLDGWRGDFAGMLFPYRDPFSGNIVGYRLRRDNPDLEQLDDGQIRARKKYLSAAGATPHCYYPPEAVDEWQADTNLTIVIVEGEKKVLALSQVAWHGLSDAAERPRFFALGLAGVWAWCGRIGKAPAGECSLAGDNHDAPPEPHMAGTAAQSDEGAICGCRSGGEPPRSAALLCGSHLGDGRTAARSVTE